MPNVFNVKTVNELTDALNLAVDGDRIELAPGEYGDLYYSNLNFASKVTITSEDPLNMATIRSLSLVNSSNIHIDSIFFDYDPDENTLAHSSAVNIDRSDNITLSNSKIEGGPSIIGVSPDAEAGEQGPEGILGLPNGRGITVIQSNNVLLENNEVSDFFRGIILVSSSDVQVLGNEVHHTRASTLAGGDLNNILVEGNYFHSANPWNFGGSGDHGDYVFFWTVKNQSEPSDNIIIRNNLAEEGDGVSLLGIVLGDRSDADVGFTNAQISGNVISNGHLLSVSVEFTDGLVINNNTLLQSSGDVNDAPQIMIQSSVKNAIIENNIAFGIIDRSTDSSNVQLIGNLIIQSADPEAPNYVGNLFVNSQNIKDGFVKFSVVPGSTADGVGSSLTQFNHSPDSLTPHFQVYSDTSSGQTLIFDASLTVGPSGFVSGSDAEFRWTFGDGSVATGQVVKHVFAAPGYQDVTLTVVDKEGFTAKAQFTAGIAGSSILQFDEKTGRFEALAFGEVTVLNNAEFPLSAGTDGYNLKLGGEGTHASVAASELSRFFGTNVFDLSMTLKADSAASWGEIARIHANVLAGVDQNGNFTLELYTDTNSRIRLISEGVVLNDGNIHEVKVNFDGDAGYVKIIIDDKVVGSASVSGNLSGGPSALYFGNPWGKQNFDGELSAFALNANIHDFKIFEGAADVISDTSMGDAVPAEPEAVPAEPEAVPAEPEAETPSDGHLPSEEDSGELEPLIRGGYKLEIANITSNDKLKLHDDTHIVDTQNGPSLYFDGKKDYASLGRMAEFEKSQKIGFSVDFTKSSADGGSERLVWNHMKVGLTLEGDGVRIHAANSDAHFARGFQIANLGLNDGAQHSATVMIDAETDRLQVVVDNVLVLDEKNTDFDFVGAGGREWGWSLGTAWNRWFEGNVQDFQVSDDFTFVETVNDYETMLG